MRHARVLGRDQAGRCLPLPRQGRLHRERRLDHLPGKAVEHPRAIAYVAGLGVLALLGCATLGRKPEEGGRKIVTLHCSESFAGTPTVPRSQPLTAFEVGFSPAGAERRPTTLTDDVRRFKSIYHWTGLADVVEDGGTPDQPYEVVGTLHFGSAWYRPEDIRALLRTHVPRVGGHAVLRYEAFQQCKAIIQDAAGGAVTGYTYEAMSADVIRFSGR